MKKINIVLFGIGKVGSTLIGQLQDTKLQWEKHYGFSVNIPVIANSTKAFMDTNGISKDWEKDFKKSAENYQLKDILDFTKEHKLDHLIAIDATASKEFVEFYIPLIQNQFNLVAANKVANTLSANFYKELRKELELHQKHFYYETNVGAGLPIVQTVQGLHQAGEKVVKIRGVFSGSLSYIFNTFSNNKEKFSEVLKKANHLGYTEPDPREDLSGNDVGRKLLILARELQLEKEFQEVKIQSLIPENLNGGTSVEEFEHRIGELDELFFQHKKNQNKAHVLRYVGEIEVGKASLEAKLISEPKNTTLGQIKGADNIFEIYTESYGDQPLVIQGAGAGAAVTARGVVSDVLKLSQRFN